MPAPNYAAKRDKNEKEIFAAIRARGIIVHPIAVPCDALCGFKGVSYLVEVKDGPKAPFTKAQIAFRKMWTGQLVDLCTVEEADAWADSVRASGGIPFRGQIE